MNRLQAIEAALATINQAAFQDLCDSFLALRNPNYAAFSRTGSQSGKQKTVKGTPDSFLLLPNGKFIFVEYSTNITTGISKLEEDIKKCLDTAKTGIQANQIAELIICVNFKLTATEIQRLNALLTNYRIRLTVYTSDILAIELHLNHRDLSNEYLGLPLDTGQIVSIDKFIEEYNRASQSISTPLTNPFLHREKEITEFNNVMSAFDFIILTGPAGIGKTKLAIEAIKSFTANNTSYTVYGVSYKHHTLLDDLFQYLDSEKDYILFVDDANRIDAFSQITGFYKATRTGKLKVIITVRDYAFQDIGLLCQEFSTTRIDLQKFSDEQIVDIIKAPPFEILNPDYQKEIVRIADGNPRLAIMAALLAKKEQHLGALHDVSDLFELYFSTFVKDDGEFGNTWNIKCLGLIAFFYTIPYKNREVTTSILQNFEIDYSDFLDLIDKLDKLELVDIQFEHIKVSEQNLSTYFFYRAFIKDDLLSFETLLNKYFDSNTNRFRDCVIPANNTFGFAKVMKKLQPQLKNHWKTIKTEEEKAFRFLNTFWYYLYDEAAEFIYNLVQALPEKTVSSYEVSYENNAFNYDKNQVIELIGDFFHFPNKIKDFIELSLEYVRKKPEHLPELLHKIREQLTFDKDDWGYRFERQNVLFSVLLKGLNNNDMLCRSMFYELAKTFLSYKFRQTKGGRNHSFVFYEYPLPNEREIQDFRENIWNAIDNNFDKNPNESFALLQSYSQVSPDVVKGIMEFDIQFVVTIIEKHLTNSSFEHCRYVQNQIRWCKRNSVSHSSFEQLKSKFINPTYEMFLKIDWDRLRDKEMFEYDNYKEYEKLKEEEIRDSFVFKSEKEVRDFFQVFTFLKKNSKNDWNYTTTLDIVIDENFAKSFDIGCKLMNEVVQSGNEINYIPRTMFRNNLKGSDKANVIWNIIQSVQFNHKVLWELAFYDYLDDSLLNEQYVRSLIATVNRIKDSYTIHFDQLQRFLKIEPNLFSIILKTIVDKNEKEKTRIQVWMDFFSTHFEQLGDDIALIKKAYIQQDKIQNHFDYEGKGFVNILNKDVNFLLEYVKSLYAEVKFGLSGYHKNLGVVWQVENIESTMPEVIDFVISREPYFGISDHFCNAFFKGIRDSEREKAKEFIIEYCKKNFDSSDKMNVIIDIVRHSLKELYGDVILLFLSLTQDVDLFSKIWWRGNGAGGSGNVILADIEAADWKNILAIVEKSDTGIKLIPIKKYLNTKIESCLRSGDLERQRRFLEQY
jgi:hypothetical protein